MSPRRQNSIRVWPSLVCWLDHRRIPGERFLQKHILETIFHQNWIRAQRMTWRTSKWFRRLRYLYLYVSSLEVIWTFSQFCCKIKVMSHGASSFMGLGFKKPISPCDRTKTCCRILLEAPCDCFYDRALLYSYNVFRETFPNMFIITSVYLKFLIQFLHILSSQ